MLHDVVGKIDELNHFLLRNGLRRITGISFDEKTWTRLRADADVSRFVSFNTHGPRNSLAGVPVRVEGS